MGHFYSSLPALIMVNVVTGMAGGKTNHSATPVPESTHFCGNCPPTTRVFLVKTFSMFTFSQAVEAVEGKEECFPVTLQSLSFGDTREAMFQRKDLR